MNNTISEANNLFADLTISESYSNHYSESKQGSGKGCKKVANNLLLISFVNKRGYFCDKCTHDLLAEQLAVRLSPSS
jgi:hypothetical protein